ncbi:MAG: NAD+ synthase [Actinobacteria bacterium]|nr:NAD+ synthase [Actinomycetota bacterium]
MTNLRVALCQTDPIVGDPEANGDAIIAAISSANAVGSDLAVFPELTIPGYPPEDLLLDPEFVEVNLRTLDKVARSTATDGGPRCVAVVGFVDADHDLFNAAAVCADGRVVGVYRKRILPNYAVFDEMRYFKPGRGGTELYRIGGARVGVSICEDLWDPAGPVARQAAGGADLVVNLSASPFAAGRQLERERMMRTRAVDAHCPIVYVNRVGAQDELVFDGGSMIIDDTGEVVARAGLFEERDVIVDVRMSPTYRGRLLDPRGARRTRPARVVDLGSIERVGRPPLPAQPTLTEMPAEAELWSALVAGTRAYVTRNGFTDVVIGLSGGLDSSAVAAIAVDAVGADHVHGVAMPSRYSSDHSISDARQLAANLGIEFRTIGIEPAHEAFGRMLAPSFTGMDEDLTEENLQARIRGITLMALSNKFGWMVLTTGNKSETSVGYSTLYGDTAGALAVIGDVFKTDVYALCRWRNGRDGREAIPGSVLTKPPSAELRPDQRDDQSLPPYDVLDRMLRAYVEADLGIDDIVAAGHPRELATRIVKMVDRAEYKRRQSPPVLRVTRRAFGKDRRRPMTNGFRTRPAARPSSDA